MSWFVWLNIVLTVAGVLYWLRGLNQGFCFHDLFPGRCRYLRGALTCRKCERVLYPERMKLYNLYRALGRIHPESES